MTIPGMKRILAGLLLGCMFPFYSLWSQQVTLIEILNADLTAFDVKLGKDATKLLGDVRLKHDDVVMSCDSAYFYQSTGSVDAFSNVKVVQADTLTLTGDRVLYDGTRKVARVRHNVKLVNKYC